MILNPSARVRILSGANILWGVDHCTEIARALHPSGVVHWVPEQLNIKAVTGACKLIDGCSLALCSATDSVVSAGLCHRNDANSIPWLYRRTQPKDSITLHYITFCFPAAVITKFYFSQLHGSSETDFLECTQCVQWTRQSIIDRL